LAFGALRTGLVLVLVLHVLNPDAFIIRTNIRHAAGSGRPFDVEYATSLSMDSVPALVDALEQLDEPARTETAHALLAESHADDWRAWNWARGCARRTLEKTMPTLRQMTTEKAQ